MKSRKIGSIQGRLLPPVNGRIQAFPTGRWEEEFPLLRGLGYSSIELTIDRASWSEHPLRSAAGRKRLSELSGEFETALEGVCCDIFMERPLLSPDKEIRDEAESMLRDLLQSSSELGLPFIELPFMGDNSLKDAQAFARLETIFSWALPFAEDCQVDVLLETDLAPKPLAKLLTRFAHPRLGLNYDTGNSTWFGFDPIEELQALHEDIRNVHIKDCTRRDYSVPLGSGETQFDLIMSELKRLDYANHFIIQGARQADDIVAAGEYLKFTKNLVNKYFAPAAAA
jgi:hexulose-6-phosphate isomerase